MRLAFTIIELIFVIVILGVLAAIAIPKMATTRNDALASTIAFNLSDCIQFSGSSFITNSIFDITSDACISASITNLCFTITPNNVNDTLLVQNVAGAAAGSVCSTAQLLTARTNISSPAGVTHQF